MPSLLDLRRRIRAVKNTQQITKAMKTVSASKLRRAQERIIGARPFAKEMRRVLQGLAGRVDPSSHPLLNPPVATTTPVPSLLFGRVPGSLVRIGVAAAQARDAEQKPRPRETGCSHPETVAGYLPVSRGSVRTWTVPV